MLQMLTNAPRDSAPRPRIAEFAWDEVAAVLGYRIYYGTSTANYSQSTAVGNVSHFPHALLNPAMNNGTTYYAVVRAYDASAESGNSNEIQVLNGQQI